MTASIQPCAIASARRPHPGIPIDSNPATAASSSGRALAVAARSAAEIHPCLVEVGEGAQRASALLVEDGPHPDEPVARLFPATAQHAQPGEREPRVGIGVAEVRLQRLFPEAALERREVAAGVRPPRSARGRSGAARLPDGSARRPPAPRRASSRGPLPSARRSGSGPDRMPPMRPRLATATARFPGDVPSDAPPAQRGP